MLLGPCSVALRQQRVCSDAMRFHKRLPSNFFVAKALKASLLPSAYSLRWTCAAVVSARCVLMRRSTRVVSASGDEVSWSHFRFSSRVEAELKLEKETTLMEEMARVVWKAPQHGDAESARGRPRI